MKALIIAGLILLSTASALATEDKYQFDSEAQQDLFFELSKELRCPKCQNQNLADSDAMIAADLKRKVHDLVKQGQNKDQVIAYMKQRYGDFVYYQPPVNSMTIWLWLLPALFVVSGMLWLVLSRKSNKVEINLDNAQQKRVDELLERDE
ncbi:MAG: cytochrome c-type biogenesis protein CcmH [Paraglaciecola sp.]|uniref:cytochrome c-type biogenesis protein n=1 Tax=Pseudomonadati TaxID=3379134 RepID=UPI00273E336F|nr:cytochrome c-type biogenesis protein [Paraglaciecola sp.]MDP5031762.1 cytochrome c-type biogenesis protein CcmH [Paraglaciecola sp.]MDP5133156.1 cytochrome c-type biogenesis protein CcmH [Paraglaciecola sp.]